MRIAGFGCLVAAFWIPGATIASEPLPNVDRVMVLQEPRAIPDATLIDQDGESFSLSDLIGKASIVFFGFTNCPDVCPAAMAKYRQLETSGLVDNSDVNYVLISVDGDRDTPAVINDYLSAISGQFIGLTGPPDEVRKVAKAFRASFFKENQNGETDSYTVTHSTQMFLLDRDGLLRAEMQNPSVDAMAQVINAASADPAD